MTGIPSRRNGRRTVGMAAWRAARTGVLAAGVAAGLAGTLGLAAAAETAGAMGPTALAPPPVTAAAGVDLAAARAALADAERAFSRLSQREGVRAAFLAYLADDAVLFRPGPVPGRAFVEARPSPPIELTWRPTYVEVAASGDLGYTTGPYQLHELHAAGAGPAGETQHGTYVTMWRRQAGGAWKVVADLVVTTPAPAGSDAAAGGEVGHGHIAGGAPAGQDRAEAAQRDLMAADRAFGGDATAHGMRAAYMAVIADDARFDRDGTPPAVGRTEIARLLGGFPQRASSWEPTAAVAASSGDLGYTYGKTAIMGPGAPRRARVPGIYLHIWERQGDGPFKLVLDLTKALPPPAPPPPSGRPETPSEGVIPPPGAPPSTAEALPPPAGPGAPPPPPGARRPPGSQPPPAEASPPPAAPPPPAVPPQPPPGPALGMPAGAHP